jgi:hypothetical protein
MRLLMDCGVRLALLLVLAASVVAQQPSPALPPADATTSIYAGLVGEWVGQLEYRDYSSNERVFLPTWLTVKAAGDGKSVQLAYTYDDGPNKTVKELSTLVLDATAGKATFTSDREHSSDTYKAEGLAEFAKTGRGKLVLTGTGVESDKKVDVRIRIAVRRNLYTYVKDTRLPGQEFQFRDGYTFTRKEPAR